MSDKRYKLILRIDQKQIASALLAQQQPHDEHREPQPKREELPNAIGETIRSVKAFGTYFDRYTTSYEYEIDGPIMFITDSGRMFSLFGDSFRSCTVRDIADINLKYNSIPAEMRQALDALCGHKIVGMNREDGLLTITLDDLITIESWDGCLHEFSEIALLRRLR